MLPRCLMAPGKHSLPLLALPPPMEQPRLQEKPL
jgi:hypothetical protein